MLIANGPAIKGGCGTWRSIRAVSRYLRQIIVPVRAGYGALFACHGIMFIESWRNRGTMFLSDRELFPIDDVPKWALAQFRDEMLVEAIY